jgi:ubiquinone/menaquinone biosynthesis C-methylase UbiE
MSVALYTLLQALLAPGGSRYIASLIESRPGRALDVGCGPDARLWPADMKPIGVDIALDRARAFGPAVVATAAALPFADSVFDSVYSIGLLHHLPDDQARTAIREMRRVTVAGGVTAILDGVLPRRPLRRPLAWLLRRLDRGRWMRRQDEIQALFDSPASWRFGRFTYTRSGLEGVICKYAGG